MKDGSWVLQGEIPAGIYQVLNDNTHHENGLPKVRCLHRKATDPMGYQP